MPIRVESVVEELEANWLDVSEHWTRKELLEYVSIPIPLMPASDLWARKVTACHLVSGERVIDDPAMLKEVYDDLDLRLVRFVATAPLEVTGYLLALGEASKRLSCNGVEVAAPTKMTPTRTTPGKTTPAA